MTSFSRPIAVFSCVASLCVFLGGAATGGSDPAHDFVFAKTSEDQPPSPTTGPALPDPIPTVKTDGLVAHIYPFRAATVGSEVRGIVDTIKAKEGQAVKEGDVIAEISKARYEAIVGEFRGNYDAVVRSLERAKDELTLQQNLYERRASTFDDLSKARSQARILESRKEEAEHKLTQAELNLKACVLTAPFNGNITVLYHEPAEPVDNLEKVFGVIDTTKVYARANWPEARLSEPALGKKAVFNYQGALFEGVIDKIATLIDPASKTKRVHVLIDNPGGRLQAGMSGSLKLMEGKDGEKVSAR